MEKKTAIYILGIISLLLAFIGIWIATIPMSIIAIVLGSIGLILNSTNKYIAGWILNGLGVGFGIILLIVILALLF